MDEKLTLGELVKNRVNWARIKAQVIMSSTADWCKEHKEAIIVFGPAIMGGIVEILKIQTKCHTVNEEKALKDQYIYDRSSGHYYELKRKPKNREWLQIDQRKQNGESLGWILNDMKLLK